MMDTFFSFIPKGIFGQHSSPVVAIVPPDKPQTGLKRPLVRSRTPPLTAEDRPCKRIRFDKELLQIKKDSPLSNIPEDVVAHCLSFLGSVHDRYALQCTSKQFRRLSNTEQMLAGVQLSGDRETGMNGIIQETDTPETAADSLAPFAAAGNLEAIYMLGIIRSYCNQDVEEGIGLLKKAACQGYVRASYALGLVLRDSHPEDAVKCMKDAADAGYLPALQELLPARTMKAKYGEPNADELRRHLDPLCLNRLLSRHYVRSAELRLLNTSHCWNPLCGRWAFKAMTNSPSSRQTARPQRMGFSFRRTVDFRVSRMKMCSRCCRAKYCSKLCQVYDWRSGRHKIECQFL